MSGDFVSKLSTFEKLCMDKNLSGLWLFLEQNPDYHQRVQRKFAELGSTGHIEFWVDEYKDTDWDMFTRQLIFFRPNDVEVLKWCMEQLEVLDTEMLREYLERCDG